MVLPNGRRVRREKSGRYRDAASGKWLSREVVEGEALMEGEGDAPAAVERSKRHLLESVQTGGYEAETPEDAWGRLIGVQAEIALDKEQGSKATAAAKLVAQATGMLPDGRGAGEVPALEGMRLEMGKGLVVQILEMIEKRREAAQEGEDKDS